MPSFLCPHPSHADAPATLKSNNDRVFECPLSHRFYRREQEGKIVFVDLITSNAYDAAPVDGGGHHPAAGRAAHLTLGEFRLHLGEPSLHLLAKLQQLRKIRHICRGSSGLLVASYPPWRGAAS